MADLSHLLRTDAAHKAFLHQLSLSKAAADAGVIAICDSSSECGDPAGAPLDSPGSFRIDRDFDIKTRILPPVTLGRGANPGRAQGCGPVVQMLGVINGSGSGSGGCFKLFLLSRLTDWLLLLLKTSDDMSNCRNRG